MTGGILQQPETALRCQRAAFSLPRDVAYLNCAYMAPFMRKVEAAGIMGIRRRRNPGGIAASDYFSDAESARRAFARLIHADDPSRVAIVSSVSYGIAIAARNLGVKRGQNIVIAGGQFPSNVYAWKRLCEERGAELRVAVAPDETNERAVAWTERVIGSVDRDTAAVAIGTVDWSDGTRFDLEAIGARARETGAAFVIDGIQSVGALDFDVRRIQPDALVCAAYKWLCGPVGVGVAYFGPRFDGGVPLEETWLGRKGSEDFRSLTSYADAYQSGVRRYDMGGRANFVLLPMMTAAIEQLIAWNPHRVQAYCAALASKLIPEVERLGYLAEDISGRCAHLFALRCPERMDAGKVQERLDAQGIHISARGDGLRISLHVFNDEEDIDRLVRGLREVSLFRS